MPASAEPPPIAASLHDRRLRITLMLDDWLAPFWVAGLVEHLAGNPGVQIVQIVLNTEPPRQRPSFLRRLFAPHRLHDLFGRIDRRRAAAHRAAFPDRDLKNMLADVPVLECLPRRRNRVHIIEDETLAAMREARPDVIWRIGFAILRGAILDAAPYGVWSYHHGDSSAYRGGPPGFWEVYDRAPVSGATLQVLTPELDGGLVLGKAWMRTHPSSPDVNFLQLEQAGQRLLADAIARLLSHGWSPAEFRATLETPALPAKRFHTRPTNLQMLRFGIRVLLPALLSGRIRRRFRPRWTVAIAPASDHVVPDISARDADWMTPPADGFVADPFACVTGGEVHVFVEEYQYSRDKGRIAVARWRAGTGFDPLQAALDEPFHLSFPFLFEHEGRVLMMPEQHETGELWAYASTEFPLRWEKYRRVMEGAHVVDAVLLLHGGRWWLFYSTATGEASDDNLYASHADTPFGPWTPHAASPLRSGLRGSRMAGAFFRRADGPLIRPAQDCGAKYGGALVFFEVVELTPARFLEREIGAADASALPEPWRDRCHTWNAAGPWRVFDACDDTAPRINSHV